MTDRDPHLLRATNHMMRENFDHEFGKDLDFLKKSLLFGTLHEDEIKELYRIAIKKIFISDEIIYEEGSPGDSVYILLNGLLKISMGDIQIDQYDEPGTAFGATILQNHPRSATLTAIKNCSFIIFPLQDLWNFIHHHPTAGVTILTQLMEENGKKLKRSAKRIVEHAQKKPVSRFHEESSLINTPVTGSLIYFDLKKSEILLRHHQSNFEYTEILSRAIFPFRIMLSSFGGIEVSHQGDGVGIFFPEKTTSTFKIINEILPKFFKIKKGVEKLFKQGKNSPPNWEINFRISIGFGSLTPSLEKLNNIINPIWKECNSQLFTESTRLNEIEKKELNPERNKTLILLSSTFVKKIKLEEPTITNSLRLGKMSEAKAKHGLSWQFYILEEKK